MSQQNGQETDSTAGQPNQGFIRNALQRFIPGQERSLEIPTSDPADEPTGSPTEQPASSTESFSSSQEDLSISRVMPSFDKTLTDRDRRMIQAEAETVPKLKKLVQEAWRDLSSAAMKEATQIVREAEEKEPEKSRSEETKTSLDVIKTLVMGPETLLGDFNKIRKSIYRTNDREAIARLRKNCLEAVDICSQKVLTYSDLAKEAGIPGWGPPEHTFERWQTDRVINGSASIEDLIKSAADGRPITESKWNSLQPNLSEGAPARTKMPSQKSFPENDYDPDADEEDWTMSLPNAQIHGKISVSDKISRVIVKQSQGGKTRYRLSKPGEVGEIPDGTQELAGRPLHEGFKKVNFKKIVNVAWDHGADSKQALLNIYEHELKKFTDRQPRAWTRVEVQWKDKKDYTTWETRTSMRQLLGNKTDWFIYRCAFARERDFVRIEDGQELDGEDLLAMMLAQVPEDKRIKEAKLEARKARVREGTGVQERYGGILEGKRPGRRPGKKTPQISYQPLPSPSTPSFQQMETS